MLIYMSLSRILANDFCIVKDLIYHLDSYFSQNCYRACEAWVSQQQFATQLLVPVEDGLPNLE